MKTLPIIIIAILIIGAIALIIISRNQPSQSVVNQQSVWRTTELIDVRTGEKFKISDLDKPILLESFAVWCPTCTQQQKQIKKLHEEIGDNFISISLDTDPNEDKQKVLEYIKKNDFNWYYAISPPELTQSLIDDFGIEIVNAPSAPVVLINTNKEAQLLNRGAKSSADLKSKLKL